MVSRQSIPNPAVWYRHVHIWPRDCTIWWGCWPQSIKSHKNP